MEQPSTTDILPNTLDFITVKEEPIQQNNSQIVNPNYQQPYFYISSFCEHKKHKTSSLRSQKSFSPSAKKRQNESSPRKKILSALSSPTLPERSHTTPPSLSKPPKYTRNLRSKSNSNFAIDLDEDHQSETLTDTLNPNKISQNPIQNANNSEFQNPLLQCDPVEMFDSNPNEKWQLKCVCGVHSGDGYLMQCDKCGFWQHYICFNYNIHTFPENYICAFCNETIIRCRCGNNLDYRYSLIKCSNCGYHVHKRCEDFLYGPMPTEGEFLCHFCGRSNNLKYKDISIPSKSSISSLLDNTYYFDSEKLTQMNNQLISSPNSPFHKLICVKFANKEISARTFAETVYNKFRSFFYVCHPLYKTTTSKKKRNRFLVSFLNSFDYLLSYFYNLKHDKVVEIIDTLINEDLYMKSTEVNEEAEDEPSDFSEAVRIELPNLISNVNNHIVKFVTIPPNITLRQTKNSGLMTMTDLLPDQFVMLVDGFIGDLEEFPYYPKVNSNYYQISNSRFVLDTTRVSNSPLNHMKRSTFGNCSLRLISVDDEIKCGLFISKNYLTINNNTNSNNMMNFNSNSGYFGNDHFTGVKSGTVLTLGIDFLPAYLDEDKIMKWISWHWNSDTSDEISNIYSSSAFDTSSDKEHRSIAKRQLDNGQVREKRKYERKNVSQSTESNTTQTNSVYYNANANKKKKRGRKMKKQNEKASTEITLFNLFEAEEAGEILINVIENDENESELDEDDQSNETQNLEDSQI